MKTDHERLLELLEFYIEGRLEGAEKAELEVMLTGSAVARHVFWEYVQQHALIGDILGEAEGARMALEETGGVCTAGAVARSSRMSRRRSRPASTRIVALAGLLAAAACVMLIAVLYVRGRVSEQSEETVVHLLRPGGDRGFEAGAVTGFGGRKDAAAGPVQEDSGLPGGHEVNKGSQPPDHLRSGLETGNPGTGPVVSTADAGGTPGTGLPAGPDVPGDPGTVFSRLRQAGGSAESASRAYLPVGRISRREGDVRYRRADGEGWFEGLEGTRLNRGDFLATRFGRARVDLNRGGNVILNRNTELHIEDSAIGLVRGEICCDFSGGAVEVVTPAGKVRHLGTRFSIELTPAGMVVTVAEGRVEAANDAGSAEVSEGFRVHVRRNLVPSRPFRVDVEKAFAWAGDFRVPDKQEVDVLYACDFENGAPGWLEGTGEVIRQPDGNHVFQAAPAGDWVARMTSVEGYDFGHKILFVNREGTYLEMDYKVTGLTEDGPFMLRIYRGIRNRRRFDYVVPDAVEGDWARVSVPLSGFRDRETGEGPPVGLPIHEILIYAGEHGREATLMIDNVSVVKR